LQTGENAETERNLSGFFKYNVRAPWPPVLNPVIANFYVFKVNIYPIKSVNS